MNIDFHYYGIAVLARAAGLEEEDALVVAYSSQYTDDSVSGQPICLGGGRMAFEPVRTAHIGLQAFDWSVQKRIYMPFHFLPPQENTGPDDSWLVITDSEFAQKLIGWAAGGGVPQGYPQALCPREVLCALGIALHTYADTWSHEGFSGRQHNENEVDGLSTRENGKWRRRVLEGLGLDLWMPEIGHAEAGRYPDLSYVYWRKRVSRRQWLEQDNTRRFLDAAETIHTFLCDKVTHMKRNKAKTEFGKLKPRIEPLLSKPRDTQACCQAWQAEFPDMFPNHGDWAYDPRRWEADALSRLDLPQGPDIGGFLGSPWVCWQRQALKQRHYVLERLF